MRVLRSSHATNSPWRVRDFRILFSAFTLSQLATNINYVAVPLVAVEALDASPAQVGALATLSTISFLLIGLPAGAWVDRISHRRVLVTADLCRAVLFATVPLAWWLDVLTLGQLYAIVLLQGCATVFFDVGSQSVLPSLVGRNSLMRAFADINTLIAAGNVAGRSAGGGLVALLTAPVTLVVAAGAYLVGGLRLTAIRPTATDLPRGGTKAVSMRTQISEGVRHTFGDRRLRALVLSASISNIGLSIVNTMLPVLFVRELGLSSVALGLFWAVGGVALLCGARSARPIANRLGYGRALGVVGLCLAPAGLLVPLLDRGPWLWLAGTGWFVYIFKVGMDNVLGVTLRQQLTPDSLLGRMNATFRFLLTGALAIGAAVSGLLGELAGVQTALWVGAGFMALAFLPLFLSPIRALRELPEPGPENESSPAGSIPSAKSVMENIEVDSQTEPDSERSDPRATMRALPRLLQYPLTLFTGKPIAGQKALSWWTPGFHLAGACLSMLAGVVISCAALALSGAWLALLLPGWAMTLHGMRNLRMMIYHQCAHRNMFRKPGPDAAIGRIIASLLIVQNFNRYSREHVSDHHAAHHMTLRDPTVQAFLVSLELRPGMERRQMWRRVLGKTVSPWFHLSFAVARVRSFWHGSDITQKVIAIAGYAVAGVVAVTLDAWLMLLVAWFVPLFPFFQVSNILRLCVKHTFPARHVTATRGKDYFGSLTNAIFIGESAPSPGLPPAQRITAWSKWIVRMLFVHAPSRYLVLTGDTVVHDFHHRYPATPRWANYIFERQTDADQGSPGWPPYRGAWGLAAGINLVFDSLSAADPEKYNIARLREVSQRELFAAFDD